MSDFFLNLHKSVRNEILNNLKVSVDVLMKELVNDEFWEKAESKDEEEFYRNISERRKKIFVPQYFSITIVF